VYSFDTFFSFWPLLSEVCLHCGPSSFYLHHRSYHVIALGMLGNLPVPLISIIWYWPSGNDSQWSEDWYCNGHASQIQWLSTRNVASFTFFGQRVVCGVWQSCTERTSPPHIVPERRQSIEMDTSIYWSGCKENSGKVTCMADNTFQSSRERWWYVAVSRCQNSTVQVQCPLQHLVIHCYIWHCINVL